MEHCGHCGKGIDSLAKFCPECGTNTSTYGKEKSTKPPDSFKADLRISHKNEITEKALRAATASLGTAVNSGRTALKKIVKLTIILSTLGAIFAGIAYYYSEIYFSPQTEFEGIKLSDTKTEVRVAKGVPDEKEDNLWTYNRYGVEYIVFSGDRVEQVLTNSGYFYSNRFLYKILSVFDLPIGEFNCGRYDYEGIKKRFGAPSEDIILESQTTRRIKYDEYNIIFYLEKNRVNLCGVYNTTKKREDSKSANITN